MEAPDISITLPHVKHSLEPYVKTRQEVTHIRRTLAAFLNSQLSHSEQKDGRSHSLLLQCECFEDFNVSTELSGLRQAYLRTLQLKRKAMRAYRDISEEIKLHGQTQAVLDGKSRDAKVSRNHFETYLDLVRQRRKHEKLLIVKDYLDNLSEKEPAKAQYLDVERLLRDLSAAPQPPANVVSRTGHTDKSLGGPTVEARLDRLKKVVLQSKHSLDYEEGRLGRLKADAASIGNGTIDNKSTGSQLNALTHVRTKLIDWIEGELANTGSSETGVVTGEKSNGSHRTGASISKYRQDIKERYQEYVKARKALLCTLSTACAPMAPPIDLAHAAVPSSRKAHDEVGPKLNSTAPLLLCCLEKHLLPLSHLQKSILQQRTQIITSLAQRQRSNDQAVNRLKEESHLLSAYPILSDNPRFRNAAAALAKRTLRKHATFDMRLTSDQEYKTVDGARAWAFAAEASRCANKDYVAKGLVTGQTNVQSASALLDELHLLLGTSSGPRKAESADPDDDPEIWASEALVKRRSKRDQQGRNAKTSPYGEDTSVGPWSKLDGKVGGLGSGI
ncbi:MAG: hypothetical protein M1812_002882 [Candelaria pacifica]|nr:MAG: hypothetical protein M1812_002882 [Candelaria pacifica]